MYGKCKFGDEVSSQTLSFCNSPEIFDGRISIYKGILLSISKAVERAWFLISKLKIGEAH